MWFSNNGQRGDKSRSRSRSREKAIDLTTDCWGGTNTAMSNGGMVINGGMSGGMSYGNFEGS